MRRAFLMGLMAGQRMAMGNEGPAASPGEPAAGQDVAPGGSAQAPRFGARGRPSDFEDQIIDGTLDN